MRKPFNKNPFVHSPVPHSKSLYGAAKAHHSQNNWRLNRDGIYVRHCYEDASDFTLSWWDDAGFIFAKRRVMVWWQHPRMIYKDQLESAAFEACADRRVKFKSFMADATPIRKAIKNTSRSKIVGYRMADVSAEQKAYFDYVHETEKRLGDEDQGWIIKPSARVSAHDWCQGVSLVFPIEIRCEDDLRGLRDITAQYLRGDRNVIESATVYTFEDWKKDQAVLEKERDDRLINDKGMKPC